ncbi:MAG TPA: uracil-DNA glycosylase family protein [Acidimicrobiales bacterium]|nr:uracil-DNA glycosylase family protein [Acidimicrobiales bacterium]
MFGEGRPGALLDKALAGAGIDREDAYVTNVVKHFKWRPAGKRRLHQKPNAAEIAACRPWLDAELACVQPRFVVLLGATAAQALLGRGFKVTEQRGRFAEWGGGPGGAGSGGERPLVLATVHPSSILRAPSDEARHAQMDAFVADLPVVAAAVRGG